jgi:hypothetical protein
MAERLKAHPTPRKALTEKERADLWARLADPDARKAYRAVLALGADRGDSVPFLRDKLAALRVEPGRPKKLVDALGVKSFAERKAAAAELEKLGFAAESALRRALADRPTLEVRRRLEQLLERLEGPTPAPENLRTLRAIEALDRMATPAARAALEKLADALPQSWAGREARAALGRPRAGK